MGDPATGTAQRAAFRDVIAALRAPSGVPSQAAAASVLAMLDQPKGL